MIPQKVFIEIFGISRNKIHYWKQRGIISVEKNGSISIHTGLLLWLEEKLKENFTSYVKIQNILLAIKNFISRNESAIARSKILILEEDKKTSPKILLISGEPEFFKKEKYLLVDPKEYFLILKSWNEREKQCLKL